MCVCVCVCVRVRACVRACVCVCMYNVSVMARCTSFGSVMLLYTCSGSALKLDEPFPHM